jgi:hypothetical protein
MMYQPIWTTAFSVCLLRWPLLLKHWRHFSMGHTGSRPAI